MAADPRPMAVEISPEEAARQNRMALIVLVGVLIVVGIFVQVVAKKLGPPPTPRERPFESLTPAVPPGEPDTAPVADSDPVEDTAPAPDPETPVADEESGTADN